MSIEFAAAPAGRRPVDAGLALPAAFATLALVALVVLPLAQGKPLLGEDNDSMLRLVQVRDLLAGQGWFDLTQYRMGLAGGFEMHWSRIVDAPLAALILLARAFGASPAAAETVALVAWPLAMASAALWLILLLARRVGGAEAVLPAAALGVAALFFSGQFRPGSIDHHSLQAVLALCVALALTEAGIGRRAGVLAGGAAASMTGIGAETHPHVALAALGVAAMVAIDGPKTRDFAVAFGLTFAAGLAAIFLSTVAPDHHGRTTCDAISIAQVAPGVAGGLALAAVAALTPPGAGLPLRLALFAAAGVAAAVLAGRYALPCLGDPLAGVDPLVRRYWLDLVEEARPLFAIGLAKPSIGLSFGAPPLIALLFVAARIRAGAGTRPLIALGAAVAFGYLIALVQIRAAVLAMILATPLLAAFVAQARRRATQAPAWPNQLVMAGAWIVSLNLVWALLGVAIDPAARRRIAEADAQAAAAACTQAPAYAALAAQPPGTVLAISNLGSAILVNTAHRAVAGPYHRNVDGMRAAIAAFVSPAEAAEAAVRATGATIVAVCPADPETRFYARAEPRSFAAALAAGRTPAWLTPVDAAAGPLLLYRLNPAG